MEVSPVPLPPALIDLPVDDLVADLRHQDLVLARDGDRLVVKGELDAMATDAIRARKLEILAYIDAEVEGGLSDTAPSTNGPGQDAHQVLSHPGATSDHDRTLTLMRNLALKGFTLSLDGDQVAIDADRDIPPELLGRLRERKPAILAVLQAQASAAEQLKARDDIADCRRTVCIETTWGRVWVVPTRTGAARVEATWAELHEDPWGSVERCHQLAAAIDLFDGKLIVSGLSLPPSTAAEISA